MKKILQLILVVVCACLYGNAENSPITVYAKCGEGSFKPAWIYAWGDNGQLWAWDESPAVNSVSLDGVEYYYYTFDGTEGNNYAVGAPINVIFKNSNVQTVDLTGIEASCVYEINEKEGDKYKATKVDTPTLKAPTISYDGKVTITRDADDATVYYRIDEGVTQEYNAPFAVENRATVTTWAEYDIFKSGVVTETIEFPTVSNPVIEFFKEKNATTGVIEFFLTISCPTEGADIYYTTTGEEPNEGNKEDNTYVNGIFKVQIDNPEEKIVVKAKAVKEGWNDSKVIVRNFDSENLVDPITIYVKADAPFTINYIYAWDNNNIAITDGWPGNKFQGEQNFSEGKYLYYTFDETVRSVNLVFTQGNNQPQTVDIKGVTGSRTFIISSEKDGDKYKVNDDTTVTGVESVSEDDVNAPVEYFNLQGVRVENPQNGLYIVRQGNKVSKQIIR